jgi:hypothetical protein
MSFNNVGHLITSTINTLQHFATLSHTSPNYTSLHLLTLHFLSFTLHYSPIWLNPSTFPIVLFHPITKLDTVRFSHPQTHFQSNEPLHCPKELSVSLHFILYFLCIYLFSLILTTRHFTLLCYSHLQLASLHFSCLHFLLFIAFTSPIVLHFPNHLHECHYDIIRSDIPETDKFLELNRYKVKPVQLHATRREKIMLDMSEYDRMDGEDPSLYYLTKRLSVATREQSGRFGTHSETSQPVHRTFRKLS